MLIDLPTCSCGHTLVAHDEPGADAPGVTWGACRLCDCREAWPMEKD